MRLLKLVDINKKDSPIHYINEFTGRAVFETLDNEKLEKDIKFSLERSATGKVDISVLIEDLNYPLVPIIKSLKTFIFDMEKRGELP